MSNTAADIFNVPSHNPSFFSVKESAVYNGPLLDFCIPVNLHFPPPQMVQSITERLPEILRYYPDYAEVHAKHIGEIAGLPAECIVPANGSTEIITRLCHLTRGPILTPIPTFSRWTDLPNELGIPLHTIEHDVRRNFRLEVVELVTRVTENPAKSLRPGWGVQTGRKDASSTDVIDSRASCASWRRRCGGRPPSPNEPRRWGP